MAINSALPILDPQKETQKIADFLKNTFQKTGFKNLVLGLSGGIDSTTSLYLVRKVLPAKNIYIAHLYYFQSLDSVYSEQGRTARDKPQTSLIRRVCSTLKIPAQNQYIISIKMPVDELIKLIQINNHLAHDRGQDGIPTVANKALRAGNIMARVRMIILYDLAKKHSALVCGTENKSEHLLGYFTRFGDEASDIEPIRHLYKSQVFELAKYLNVPEEIIKAKPTAGLWAGQTDEGQFGFTYQEADPVLHLYFEKKLSIEDIEKRGHKNARKIIDFALNNSFKHRVPYSLY